MPFLDLVEASLSRRLPEAPPDGRRIPAAVALILRQKQSGAEILFIERARHERDPWSGDLGFPGGKVEKKDADPCSAAKRETLEEIGLDLHQARFLGRLSEITGATLPVRVVCFIFAVDDVPALRLNHEVQDAFWVALDDLMDLKRHQLAPVTISGSNVLHPAIILPLPGKPPLWGLTYRMIIEFLKLLPPKTGN